MRPKVPSVMMAGMGWYEREQQFLASYDWNGLVWERAKVPVS